MTGYSYLFHQDLAFHCYHHFIVYISLKAMGKGLKSSLNNTNCNFLFSLSILFSQNCTGVELKGIFHQNETNESLSHVL